MVQIRGRDQALDPVAMSKIADAKAELLDGPAISAP